MRTVNESIARWIWFQILTASRRGRSRKGFRRILALVPPEKQAKFLRQRIKEERFARRFAVPALKAVLTLAWISLLLSAAIATHTYLVEAGILKPVFNCLAV